MAIAHRVFLLVGSEARDHASLAPVHTKPDTLRVVFRYVVG
jgi:hypothetical protein